METWASPQETAHLKGRQSFDKREFATETNAVHREQNAS